jgi:Activator of Hsp90 ATPase homolog 1-like protein
VIRWRPGAHLALTWAQPDWPEDVSTYVDVRFEPLTDATLVSLEQRGFERVGPDAAELCAEYGAAWQEALRWLAARTRVTGRDAHRRKSVRLHGGLIRAAQAAGNAAMTPLTKILLSSALGVAAAAAVVAIHSTAADAIGGALALVSLIVVTRSAIQMAGDSGSPEDGGHLTDGSSRGPRAP